MSLVSSNSKVGVFPSVEKGTTSTPLSISFSINVSLSLEASVVNDEGPTRITRRASPLNSLTVIIFFSSTRGLRNANSDATPMSMPSPLAISVTTYAIDGLARTPISLNHVSLKKEMDKTLKESFKVLKRKTIPVSKRDEIEELYKDHEDETKEVFLWILDVILLLSETGFLECEVNERGSIHSSLAFARGCKFNSSYTEKGNQGVNISGTNRISKRGFNFVFHPNPKAIDLEAMDIGGTSTYSGGSATRGGFTQILKLHEKVSSSMFFC
ncbi:hypothetical protein L6452_27970 [Arctium lappa]|uniref:Uncharacterized protein n=1 Tax=Arctium lappa TaxID=4217 RepID=A0ACB8ZXN0_ARCLA|nr:hypothetical protein L6452_27970 [Arctium lappa]